MPLPIALVPIAISAVRSLLKLRIRVDNILSVKEVSACLPFALPPLPQVDFNDTDDMIAYFKTDAGKLALEVADQTQAFAPFLALPPSAPSAAEVESLLKLYYQASGQEGVEPTRLSRQPVENLLISFLVDSYRVSHHPATVRLLLATADTLLEFAGENATLFLSNPKTASIVGVLLSEFAGRRDFDDIPLEQILKTLLGSALVAAMENQDVLPEHPALLVLYAALGEVRAQQGDDFAAQIISAEGFQQVVSSYLTHAATDPAFLDHLAQFAGTTSLDSGVRQVLRGAFSATLTRLGTDFHRILQDPAAFRGVLEAAIIAVAANAKPLVRTLDDGSPVLAAVLTAVSGQVAQHQNLFASLGNGVLIGAIYRAALAAVSVHPDLNADGVASTVERVVGGLARELAQQSLQDVLQAVAHRRGLPVVNLLLARTVTVLAETPQILVGNNAFAEAVVGAVLSAGAPLSQDGLDVDDLVAVVQAGLQSATGNLALLKLDEPLRAALATLGQASAAGGPLATKLAAPENRKDTLLVVLQALAANPSVWEELSARDLVQPLVKGLLGGLQDDPSRLLTGPMMVQGLRLSLQALNRRGSILVAEVLAADTTSSGLRAEIQQRLQALVTRILQAANQALGRHIMGEDVPAFLGRVLSAALRGGLQAADDAIEGVLQEVLADFDQRI